MIEFEGVGVRYGDRDILSDVSLSLARGSMHFLTGRSGAGKTTLLRLVYLALAPTSGAARVFGEEVAAVTRRDKPALRRRMGVVLQDCDLLDHLSLLDNIALPLRVAGGGRKPDGELRELGAWVGLGDRLDARPPELSSGERQRAAIARAVVASPDLLIADEPTGNVDAEAAERILRLFTELNRLGVTVLIATHDLGLLRAAQGARAHTLRLDRGRITRSGAPL